MVCTIWQEEASSLEAGGSSSKGCSMSEIHFLLPLIQSIHSGVPVAVRLPQSTLPVSNPRPQTLSESILPRYLTFLILDLVMYPMLGSTTLKLSFLPAGNPPTTEW